jgi:hypothetical protein
MLISEGRKCGLVTARREASLSLVRERDRLKEPNPCTPYRTPTKTRNAVRRPAGGLFPFVPCAGALRLILILGWFGAAAIGPSCFGFASFSLTALSLTTKYSVRTTNETNGGDPAGKERSANGSLSQRQKREEETALSTTLIRVSRLEAMHIATLRGSMLVHKSQPRCHYGPEWLHFPYC